MPGLDGDIAGAQGSHRLRHLVLKMQSPPRLPVVRVGSFHASRYLALDQLRCERRAASGSAGLVHSDACRDARCAAE
jgi:hypothetical protein